MKDNFYLWQRILLDIMDKENTVLNLAKTKKYNYSHTYHVVHNFLEPNGLVKLDRLRAKNIRVVLTDKGRRVASLFEQIMQDVEP